MRTIWKFTLATRNEAGIFKVPEGAHFFYAGQDPSGELCAWAYVNTAEPEVHRRIAVVGTGQPFPFESGADFLGTVVEGPYVWHIFAEMEAYHV